MLGHDLFWVDDRHRTLGTAVHAARLVHPHPAGAGQAQFLDPLLGVVPQGVGPVVLAARGTVRPLIGTKEDVVAVIGHGVYIRSGSSVFYSGVLQGPDWLSLNYVDARVSPGRCRQVREMRALPAPLPHL